VRIHYGKRAETFTRKRERNVSVVIRASSIRAATSPSSRDAEGLIVITLACFEDISGRYQVSTTPRSKRFAPRRIHILPIRSSLFAGNLAFAAAAIAAADDGYLPIPIGFVIELQAVAMAAAELDERIEARDYQTRYSASDGWDNPGWLVGYKARWRTMKRNAQR